MKKTLGGDRLGAGSKMQVDLHGYTRSTHNLGYLWRSTMAAGTLVPFICEVALPGDSFEIDLDADVKTHPTIGPLFGSYKMQLDVFQAPIRLYQGKLHNNKLGIGMNMSQIKLPLWTIACLGIGASDDIDNSQINPSSLISYLGIRGVGMSETDQVRLFNAVPGLAYWDTYKNYYANKQEEIGMQVASNVVALVETVDDIQISGGGSTTELPQSPASTNILMGTGSGNYLITVNYTGAEPVANQIMIKLAGADNWYPLDYLGYFSGSGTGVLVYQWNQALMGNKIVSAWRYITPQEMPIQPIEIVPFPLENIDNMREAILAHSQMSDAFSLGAFSPAPYGNCVWGGDGQNYMLASQQGLGIKTYQSDLFNNWLSTEWIDGTNGISEITAVDTTEGSFTIDTLNLSRKVYDMLNRIAVSGGSYDDWIDAVYTHDRYVRCESPMYMGGMMKELVFQEVVSNAEATSDQGTQPLGSLAGKGVLANKKKGGRVVVKVDEPSYVMGIVSLTPRLDYSQGNKWDVNLKTMDDFHKPALDEIGFQELITEQMAWWSTNYNDVSGLWEQKSAGKQPAWINYMTNVNQVRGNFAIKDNEMFMTLNRRYEHEGTPGIDDGMYIKDLTTYIDPAKYNFIFAETSLDSQNFWVQIAVDMSVRRKISARVMPNL